MSRQNLIEFFIAEAEDHLGVLEKGVLSLEKNPEDTSMIEDMFRAAHTLKGSAALVKLNVTSEIGHLMEDIFEEIKDNKRTTTSELATWMLKALDTIKILIKTVREGGSEDSVSFDRLKSSLPVEIKEAQPFEPAEIDGVQPVEAVEIEEVYPVESVQEENTSDEPLVEKRVAGRRREDVETIDSKFVRIDIDNVEQIMNLMGELTIIKNYLLSQARGVHELSDEINFAGRRLLNEVGNFSDRYSYSIPDKIKYVDTLLSEFHELEFDRYDELNLFARKLQEITNDISEALTSLSDFFDSFSVKVHAMERLISNTKELVSEARMVDIGRLYQRFTRAVRDISLQHGKKIRFLSSGYETKIDKIIFERLFESLLHILRNAIAHGIETPEERIQKGKPEEGIIHLNSYREGNSVVIEVKDFGRGLDFEKIRTISIKKGFIQEDATPSQEELLQYIFSSGFSTAESADMTSGRGVGLDVVKETLSVINGSIEVFTEKDVGTTFKLRVPLSLIIINVVIFESGGMEFIVPSTLVQELAEVPINDLLDTQTFTLRESTIPFKNLNSVFGLVERRADKSKPVIVLNISGKYYGIVVDQLKGQEDTIIKPFGSFLEGIKHFSGVSISADGKIRPVLNPSAIVDVEAISLKKIHDFLPADEGQRDTVLIVDDSLSVRKYASAILEARNYHAFTATNGLEALNIIDENKIDLVITDLEMPVMHGYELLGELRRRGLLKIIPAIVLTSRSSEKHREKAFNLGASDFLIKPFDEVSLMETVKRHIHSHHLT